MDSELIVPVLAAGPFLTDVDLIRKAPQDPYIPLITTVPAMFTGDEGRQFIERQRSRARQGIGYSFAIAHATSDRAASQAGLWLQAIGQGRAAVGYRVTASARGNGAAAHASLPSPVGPCASCAFIATVFARRRRPAECAQDRHVPVQATMCGRWPTISPSDGQQGNSLV